MLSKSGSVEIQASTAVVNALTNQRTDKPNLMVFPISEIPDGIVSRSVADWLTKHSEDVT
jgi:hypothetical protein